MPRTKLSKTKTRTPSPPTSSQVFEGAQALALVPGQFLAPSSSLAHSSTSTASVGAAPAPAQEVDQLRERFDALAPPEPRLNPVAAFAALVCSPPPQWVPPPPAAANGAELVRSPPPRPLSTLPPQRPTAEFLALMAETFLIGQQITDVGKTLIDYRQKDLKYLEGAEKYDSTNVAKGATELYLQAQLNHPALQGQYAKLKRKFDTEYKFNNWSLNAAELAQKLAIDRHYVSYADQTEKLVKLENECFLLRQKLQQRGF